MPARSAICASLLAAAAVFAGCGYEEIDANTYTCGEFQKSLDTKDNETAGQYIRLLNDRAKLKGRRSDREKVMAYAIFAACRGEKASVRPANKAVANAKAIQAGKQVLPKDASAREKKAAAEAAEKKKPAE